MWPNSFKSNLVTQYVAWPIWVYQSIFKKYSRFLAYNVGNSFKTCLIVQMKFIKTNKIIILHHRFKLVFLISVFLSKRSLIIFPVYHLWVDQIRHWKEFLSKQFIPTVPNILNRLSVKATEWKRFKEEILTNSLIPKLLHYFPRWLEQGTA